jgi:hypothetical protein
MDKDFHYYALGLLARAAGFTESDALTIAYASQYVDNATESEPLRVGGIIFDPVRTAHYGLQTFDWSTQKRVFIPFHFLPPKGARASADSFVTQPNSPLAQMIFEKACQEPEDTLRLISIGIALHALADSWAHQGFAGKEDPINEVDKIYRGKENAWEQVLVIDTLDFSSIPGGSIVSKLLAGIPKRIGLALEAIYLNFLPKVGHVRAGWYPDYPFLKWKCARGPKKETLERDNTTEFLTAAETIYNLLVSVEKPYSPTVLPWSAIKTAIRFLLGYPEQDVEQRCKKWREQYKSLFGDNQNYQYDQQRWRLEALNPPNKTDIAWDKYKPAQFARLSFPLTADFYHSHWVKFHQAALRQRHFVLEYCFSAG